MLQGTCHLLCATSTIQNELDQLCVWTSWCWSASRHSSWSWSASTSTSRAHLLVHCLLPRRPRRPLSDLLSRPIFFFFFFYFTLRVLNRSRFLILGISTLVPRYASFSNCPFLPSSLVQYPSPRGPLSTSLFLAAFHAQSGLLFTPTCLLHHLHLHRILSFLASTSSGLGPANQFSSLPPQKAVVRLHHCTGPPPCQLSAFLTSRLRAPSASPFPSRTLWFFFLIQRGESNFL